jgi:hypothetical protein
VIVTINLKLNMMKVQTKLISNRRIKLKINPSLETVQKRAKKLAKKIDKESREALSELWRRFYKYYRVTIFSEGRAFVQKTPSDNNFVCINTKGEQAFPGKFRTMSDFSQGTAIVQKADGKWIVLYRNGIEFSL